MQWLLFNFTLQLRQKENRQFCVTCRKQREEAAAKRASDQKAKEDAAKAKVDATAKALGKKK